MTDLYIEGPDAIKLFSDVGINSVKTFKVNQGKQLIATNYDGYLIGDAILFYLSENKFNLVGRPPLANWLQYNAEAGKYNVKLDRDERSFENAHRKTYRFQIQGPNALKVMQKLTGKPVPEIRFFNVDIFKIAGLDVPALRHGMVGQPGWELWGPWEQGDQVRNAFIEAGQEFGMRQVGARAYPTSCLESGWIPSPLPAVYTGEKMKPYRQWLTGKHYESMASLGGSFTSDNIEDYYLSPYDIGYGPFVKFDHDFIGKAGVEKLSQNQKRKKVTLVWNGEDVAKVFASLTGQTSGDIYKYIDMPIANYATLMYDKVTKGGKTIGISTYAGTNYPERAILSLAMLDNEQAEPGTQVTLVWGEEGGGSTKPTVEKHKQIEIRATVAPVPISSVARDSYRPK
jgi:glycine cleavage system aminomethyltransferase T